MLSKSSLLLCVSATITWATAGDPHAPTAAPRQPPPETRLLTIKLKNSSEASLIFLEALCAKMWQTYSHKPLSPLGLHPVQRKNIWTNSNLLMEKYKHRRWRAFSPSLRQPDMQTETQMVRDNYENEDLALNSILFGAVNVSDTKRLIWASLSQTTVFISQHQSDHLMFEAVSTRKRN